MADRIILPRAFDSNGNIVAGARAYFYDTGTTNTQTVYSDSAGTTPVSQPLVADSAGAFAATFATSVVKVDIVDDSAASLPGFPSDPHPKVPATGSAASAVSFVPSTENPATNVQDAIDDLTTSPDFSAITNAATVREDLGLEIGVDVISVSAFVGAVLPFAMDAPPTGWLECDGSAISRTTYAALFAAIGTVFGVGDGSTTFNLPDLRGEFIRGWDNTAGNDPDAASRTDSGDGSTTGDNVGTKQADAFESHDHALSGSGGTTFAALGGISPHLALNSAVSPSEGGNETRPRNVALMFCIKY